MTDIVKLENSQLMRIERAFDNVAKAIREQTKLLGEVQQATNNFNYYRGLTEGMKVDEPQKEGTDGPS